MVEGLVESFYPNAAYGRQFRSRIPIVWLKNVTKPVFKEIEFRVISVWRGNFRVFLVAQNHRIGTKVVLKHNRIKKTAGK